MNANNPTYEEIISNTEQFEALASLSYDKIKPFIRQEITANQGWAKVANMYQLTGVLLFILGLFKAFMPFFAGREYIYLIYLGSGLLFTCSVLIILHELIHALTFKCTGAKNISFGMKLKQFIFYVQSDKEVYNYSQYKIIALAPAVVVSVFSLAGMAIFYDQPMMYFLIPVFSFHSFFCGGDFGMLCFFQNRPDREIYTFDVKESGESFFYARKNG